MWRYVYFKVFFQNGWLEYSADSKKIYSEVYNLSMYMNESKIYVDLDFIILITASQLYLRFVFLCSFLAAFTSKSLPNGPIE